MQPVSCLMEMIKFSECLGVLPALSDQSDDAISSIIIHKTNM